MRDMQKRFHTNFIFSTHDPMFMSHADRVLRTRDGVVTPEDIATPEAAPC
jgi:ABC-type lipoprotein export system ATPase subunit